MKILIVGGGGREHAIAWALHRENPAVQLSAAPGNPGLATLATLLPIPADDIDRLTEAAVSGNYDLTVVGPEVPKTGRPRAASRSASPRASGTSGPTTVRS